jgi:hypothetical protein
MTAGRQWETRELRTQRKHTSGKGCSESKKMGSQVHNCVILGEFGEIPDSLVDLN